MGAPGSSSSAPPASAVQSLINNYAVPPASVHAKHLHHLALQIAHNLRFQHGWTDLRLHTASPLTQRPLPRPIISGLPPERLYVHPDEQIELLQKQKDAGKAGMPELSSEREWVLPSHLREKWSLSRFGEVFDGVDTTPEPNGGVEVFNSEQRLASTEHNAMDAEPSKPNEWRTKKRVLLATLDDDSTIVYYIVHDGIVKPRQN